VHEKCTTLRIMIVFDKDSTKYIFGNDNAKCLALTLTVHILNTRF